MVTEPVVIDIDIFLASRPTDPNPMTDIASQLCSSYACFKDQEGVKWTVNKPFHHGKKAPEKPRIGEKELSREHLAKKEFLSIINKLSANNFASLLEQFRKHMRVDFISLYVDMIWDAMMRSPDFQVLYIELLKAIDSVHSVFGDIHRIWDQYVSSQSWLVAVHNTSHSSADYDEFCDQVKAKKRAISAVRGWVLLTRHQLCNPSVADELFTKLLDQSQRHIDNATYDKNLEALLDEILEFLSTATDGHGAVPYVQTWSTKCKELPPMIRFKVYDICEKLNLPVC